MKLLISLLTLATATQAHYNFPSMAGAAAWSNVRQWTNYYSFTPVTDVTSDSIRCNVNGTSAFAPNTLSIAAGSKLDWAANPDIYHPGPLLGYMAKAPAGKTAANWDGAGSVWFKIYEDHPTVGASALSWPSDNAKIVSFTIPASLPAGDYLMRIEHIGLHVAQSAGGAQFYISCGQLTVTGGGSGNPSPLVAFPGAYSATDPGILLNIYNPVPKNYTPPGPTVWTG